VLYEYKQIMWHTWEDFVRDQLTGYQWTVGRVKHIALTLAKERHVLNYSKSPEETYTGFTFGTGEDQWTKRDFVYTTFEEYHCGSCGPESTTVEFPISYLWMPNYTALDAKVEAERLEALHKAEEEEVARQAQADVERRENNDRQNYIRLREKYKDDPSFNS
jgi:hypothetical protein